MFKKRLISFFNLCKGDNMIYNYGNLKNESLSDNELLDLIQKAFTSWKKAEKMLHSQQLDPNKKEKLYFFTCKLKKMYITLLLDSRKRELTLSREQLLSGL